MSSKLSRLLEICEDYKTLCRLCLEKKSLKIDIYQEEVLQREIPEKILKYLSLKVSKDDLLPKLVCMTCIGKLDDFQDFRDMCHESENLLSRCISEMEERNHSKQHDKDSSISPLSPLMETGTNQESDSVESHLTSQEPTPDFVSCSIKAEPEDDDPSSPSCEDTIGDILESNPLAVVKSEPMEEQMNVDGQHTSGDTLSKDCLQTDAGTSASERQESECVDSSEESSQFGVDAFEDSDNTIEQEEVKMMQVKIENDNLASEGERTGKDSCGIGRDLHRGYMHNSKHSHLRGTSSLSNASQIPPQCSEQSTSDSSGKKLSSNVDSGGRKISKFSNCKNVFFCPECKKLFARRDHLEIHMRIHTGDKPFLCSTCNKAFRRKSDLRMHSIIHTGEKPFVCSTCNRAFARSYELKKHSRKHTEKPFSCSECNKSFAKKEELKKHSMKHGGEMPFLCSTCNEEFPQRSDLNKHSRIHTKEKVFDCLICNKTFTTKHNLKLHSRIHIGEKEFVCLTCSKAFVRKDHLRKHSRIHAEGRAFVCATCNKAFGRKDDLQKHSRIHTAQKAFACPTCNTEFARKESLDIHLEFHTGENHCAQYVNKNSSHSDQEKASHDVEPSMCIETVYALD